MILRIEAVVGPFTVDCIVIDIKFFLKKLFDIRIILHVSLFLPYMYNTVFVSKLLPNSDTIRKHICSEWKLLQCK